VKRQKEEHRRSRRKSRNSSYMGSQMPWFEDVTEKTAKAHRWARAKRGGGKN